MEKDLREIREEINRKLNPQFDVLVGKISQMIEELPWLWELEINVYTNQCKIAPDVKIILKTGKVVRPDF
jgi:hypothetical protein